MDEKISNYTFGLKFMLRCEVCLPIEKSYDYIAMQITLWNLYTCATFKHPPFNPILMNRMYFFLKITIHDVYWQRLMKC